MNMSDWEEFNATLIMFGQDKKQRFSMLKEVSGKSFNITQPLKRKSESSAIRTIQNAVTSV